MTSPHLDQYLHLVNQSISWDLGHSAQKQGWVCDLNVEHHVTEQYFCVWAPLKDRFLSKQMMEHPEIEKKRDNMYFVKDRHHSPWDSRTVQDHWFLFPTVLLSLKWWCTRTSSIIKSRVPSINHSIYVLSVKPEGLYKTRDHKGFIYAECQ